VILHLGVPAARNPFDELSSPAFVSSLPPERSKEDKEKRQEKREKREKR